MQEGAGVRQIVEDALRRQGVSFRDLDVRLELGLQESVRQAVEAGYGVTFISRTAVESELAAGRLVEARVEGLDATREISLASATGRARTRAADAFVDFRTAAARRVIVRWGLEGLDSLLGGGRDRAERTPRHEHALRRPRASGGDRFTGVRRHAPLDVVEAAREAAAEADGLVGVGGGSAIDTAKAVSAGTGLPLVAVPTTYAGSEWTSYFGMRDETRRAKTGGGGAQHRRDRLRAGTHAGLAARRVGRDGHERARTLRGGAVRRAVRGRDPRRLADRARIADGRRRRPRRRGTDALLEGAMHAGRALAERGLFLAHAMAQALGGRYAASHGR